MCKETHPEQNQHDELFEHLTLLADNAGIAENLRELAQSWRQRIDRARTEANKSLSVAFLAEVGSGKSSLIAAASDLRLDNPGLPNKWSVLPVGSGRTTLGETHIHFEERGDARLVVEPIPATELQTEIKIFAQDQWRSLQGKSGGRSTENAGEELHDLLRAWLAPGVEDPRKVLKQAASSAATIEDLETTWLDQIDLGPRSQRFEQIFTADKTGYKSLKACLKALMKGRLAEAPAPRITHVHLPMTELGREIEVIVDTQGIDTNGSAFLDSRSDIRERISESSLLVICSSFSNAPDPVSRELLEFLTDHQKETRDSAGVRLLIVDKEPIDDDNPRERKEHEHARRDRIEQCRDILRRNEQIDLPESAVDAIDVRFDSDRLKKILLAMAQEKKQALRSSWKEVLNAAETATDTLRDEDFATKVREFDLQLWWAWDAEIASAPVGPSDGLLALATLFEQASFNDFHWSQLYASTRRRGRYWKLDLVKLGAGACSRSATVPYQHAVIEVRKTAESLTKETDSAITDHIAMRRDQFKEAWLDHRRALYEAWSQTLQTHFASPDSTPMWRDCVDRWGRGRGYVADVAQRLRKEAEQAALKPKLVPPISGRLPKRPKLFSLQKIRLQNFRCVEEREINFAQTTVLIGNNGIGKTCWLEAIAAAIGIFLTGVGAANARTICETDIRHVYQERGGILTVTTNCPC